MPTCSRIRGRRRGLCAGDLDKEIKLQERDIVPPIFNNSDFDEDFADKSTVWAMIKTVHGKTFFDGVNQRDVNLTHEIYIRFDDTVSAETWVLYDGRRFDIMATEDLDERHEFLKLSCVDKGASKV